MWLDSHCHLVAREFDADRAATLDRASAAGVDTFVAIGSGYGIAGNARAVELAAADPRVFATVGVHPHEAKEFGDEARALLEELLGRPRVVAVGECGLDYHYMNSEREVQRAVFAEQAASARSRRMPATIHVRGDEPNAFEELLDIWRTETRGEVEGVLHCYTGTLEFARRAIEVGFYISFSGILTFKNDRGLREVAKALPLERLMVETDAPLLAPQGFRGKRNEPAHVALVGEVIAELHELPAEEVARATSENARKLFRLGEA
ncbi:MAG: TatD family hydrolase [Deltaproteobacteria bacterium]|nr:TatD family hydrolase [Deltaproteobacteria bacterium]